MMLSIIPLIRRFCHRASRHISSATRSSIEFNHNENCLLLRTSGQLSSQLDFTWLRHNCQCPYCHNPNTYQNEIQLHHLVKLSVPKSININKENNMLHVKWCDDHDSVYNIRRLLDNFKFQETVTHDHQLWDGSFCNPDWPRVTYEEFQAPDDEGVGRVLQNVLQSGFCLLENVFPPNNETEEQLTQQVIEKVCFVQKTFWGEMWRISVDKQKADSAYSNCFIPPHNDCTYLIDAPGMIVFHCLKPADSGGETILVDGFKLAHVLSEKDPEAYRMLSTFPLEARFVNYEPGVSKNVKGRHNYYNRDVILKHDAFTGKIVQIRFNPLDMLPVRTVQQSDVHEVYEALNAISILANDAKFAIRLMLKQGTILFVDNFRLLHARESFFGERVLCGSYVGRADWLSKARILGVL